MRIGIDCKTILNKEHGELAGVGHYTYFMARNVIERDSNNQYVLFFHNPRIEANEFKLPNVTIVHVPFARYKRFLPLVYSHLIVPLCLYWHRLTIYHNPANSIPLLYFKKSVITVHDLAIYKNKQWFPKGQWFSRRVLVPSSIMRAAHIIAVSGNTKRDIMHYFHTPAERISVVYEGVAFNPEVLQHAEMAEGSAGDGRYFLYIGTLEPRKNIVRMIEAFARFRAESGDPSWRLIIAGKRGWNYEDIFQTITSLGLEDAVRYLGYVRTREKIALLKGAFAFVFVSLYEGFGLPVLEAMYFGTPVITSNVASIPEIILDNAVLVDPSSVDSIAHGMRSLADDESLRAGLQQKGRVLSNAFRWEQTAKETIAVYQLVVSGDAQ